MRGPLMFETLQENSRKHEIRVRDAEKRIAEANSDELRVEHELAQNLAKLADLQIEFHPDLGEAAIRQLELRADEEKNLRSQLAGIEQEITGLMQQLHTTLAEIYRAEHKEKQSLTADRVYQVIRDEYTDLLMRHRAMEANHRDVAEEVKRKLPAFDQNPVYRHLCACQFGTDAYRGKGLARYMDNWLAQISNFSTNRQSEATLRAMQREIEEGAENRKQKLESLKKYMEPMLRSAAHQAGLPDLCATQDRLNRQIEEAKLRANAVNDRIAEFTERRDIRYIRIREAIVGFLAKQSPEILLARARRTATQEDSVVANRVINLQFELKRIQDSLQLLQSEREQAQRAYEKAKSLEHRLKDTEFAGDGVDYSAGPDMQSVIHGFMTDRLTLATVLDVLRSHRNVISPAG